MKTLITGVSTRAIAESAVKSGHDIFTIDYFGDSDQKQIVENYSLLRDFNLPFRAENLIHACSRFDFDSLVYISNFENFPELLEKLPERIQIFGNSPETLRNVRDWKKLRDFMISKNIPFPDTLLPGEEKNVEDTTGWLLKPTNSGGGSGIKEWEGEKLSDNRIIQKLVKGIPASAAFLANGQKSVLIGLAAQLIGLRELGIDGYTWCGNILPLPLDRKTYLHLVVKIEKYISLLTSHFKLKGACGIDFIVKGNNTDELKPYILEINPRYTASMELIEKVFGLNIYSLHIQAVQGSLPDFSIAAQTSHNFHAKGVLFARNNIKIKNTRGWEKKGIKDIPFEGDEITAGHPVCSIFTDGSSYKGCKSNLFKMADRLRLETCDIPAEHISRKAI
ncbi:MAG: ATP-grasp domain-containing protein [Desulfobacteraceae bacterium]|jgi:hypothetical protein